MKNNSKAGCSICNQVHRAEFKDCSDGRLPLEIMDKNIPSSDPRMSWDADNGVAIVAGHAEEG